MQASVRPTTDNFALVYALRRAAALRLPLVVAFALTASFPGANARSYSFLLEGVLDAFAGLADAGIGGCVLLPADGEAADASMPARVAELAAALASPEVVTDAGYLHIQEQWRTELAAELDDAGVPLVQVEANVVVPVEVVTDKVEYAARTIRPKINRLRDDYLVPLDDDDASDHGLSLVARPGGAPASTQLPDGVADALGELKLSRAVPADELPREVENKAGQAWIAERVEAINADVSVAPVAGKHGGWRAGRDAVDAFVDGKLRQYAAERNVPSQGSTSGLSAYLHYGHIGPVSVARRVVAAKKASSSSTTRESADAFLEEMVVRRELSMNFCHFMEGESYAKYETAHEGDARQWIYTADELDAGLTHDPFWNAAQREMVLYGDMHGYARMYWSKKVIEWTESPKAAYAWLRAANDKYELDGRDPNGYVGVAWCFGRHDRPWTRRDIFGSVRYMNDKGLLRKFKDGIRQWAADINAAYEAKHNLAPGVDAWQYNPNKRPPAGNAGPSAKKQKKK
ncbi:deoxyribodipyrimidine photolyase [Thecamonas trahens ATCC 50062]|uniref:Deoxyribodipyrimidine photo-lyase n=1 Tax=Thecamonas trahens ATCC 50062 TaxID=461836 RepID=A0A0L0DL45_THETB|nr:deoxyribodipyrimidine photolyase [Thecamonas trahens ATCC 50062]KNC52093.1 deoxyribodipyrimidine photolyase [Thecamonas trahens ATCC 50062]|eukprot:XP_013762098.1 deoxyribodipyrimidine photolyase [Thecamonas trahens ATCC 50062]